MTAAWAWGRSELSRRRGGALALVLLIGISGAVVLTTAAGARRTDTAFERYVEQSRTADVQVQYSNEEPPPDDAPPPTPAEAAVSAREDAQEDAELLAALRADPDVAVAAPVQLTFALADGVDYELTIFHGPSPLLEDVDVPRIVDGRAADPTKADEIVINRFAAELLDAGPGDDVNLGTFNADQMGPDGPTSAPAGPILELEVAGIAETPYDLADAEAPNIYGTAAFYDEYANRLAGFGPIIEVRTTDVPSSEAVVERIIEPFDLYETIIGTSDDQTSKVADGTGVTAAGLAAFAAVAGLAALVACTQALHRRIGDSTADLPSLQAMGLTRGQQAVAVVLSVAPIVIGGFLLAAVLSIPGSLAMPLGVARRAEPDPGIDVDPAVVGGLALLGIGLLLGAAALTSWRATRGVSSAAVTVRRRPVLARGVRNRLAPAGQVGMAMALDPGGPSTRVPVRSALTGAAFGVGGVVAALTFGAGLDHLMTAPAASGWNWTVRPEIDEENEEAELATLIDVPGVQDVGRMAIGQVSIEGRGATGYSMRAEAGSPTLTVLDGRMPASDSEVTLGPELARRLGVGIGDEVEVDGLPRPLTIVGRALVPDFDDNPFNEGVVLMPASLDELRGREGDVEYLATFDPSISEDEAGKRVEEALPDSISIYSFATLPPDVDNLKSVRFLPQLLGAFLALLALAAVAHALLTSVRRRRADLGVVRTFGFATGHVVRTVIAQSVTWVVVGLVVGIPLGIAAGRLMWRAVADGLGVASEAPTSLTALVGVPLAVLVLSVAVGVLPGRAAGRMRAVDALRVE